MSEQLYRIVATANKFQPLKERLAVTDWLGAVAYLERVEPVSFVGKYDIYQREPKEEQ